MARHRETREALILLERRRRSCKPRRHSTSRMLVRSSRSPRPADMHGLRREDGNPVRTSPRATDSPALEPAPMTPSRRKAVDRKAIHCKPEPCRGASSRALREAEGGERTKASNSTSDRKSEKSSRAARVLLGTRATTLLRGSPCQWPDLHDTCLSPEAGSDRRGLD